MKQFVSGQYAQYDPKMEPDSLSFVTLIVKLQRYSVAIWRSAKYHQRPFPALKPLD